MKPTDLVELSRQRTVAEAIIKDLNKHDRIMVTLNMPNGTNRLIPDEELSSIIADTVELYYINKVSVIADTLKGARAL